jgi:hypothetical protein
MPDETPDPQLNAFARSLATVAPHPGRLDRDGLLFAAGQAAQARHGRVWRVGTLLFALTSAGLGGALTMRPASVVEVERVVYLQASPPSKGKTPPPAESPPAVSPGVADSVAEWAAGVRLRERVLEEGIAGLPTPTPLAYVPAPPLSERDIPELAALRPAELRSVTGETIR